MEQNTKICPECRVTTLDHITSIGDGPEPFRICPVCHPDDTFTLPDSVEDHSLTMPYHCKDCNSVEEPEVDIDFHNGRQYIEITCAACGSDRVQRVDDMYDEAAYRMEER